MNATLNAECRTDLTISLDTMNQQGSPCRYAFLTVTPKYNSKVTPNGAVHAEKLDGVGPVDNRPSTD